MVNDAMVAVYEWLWRAQRTLKVSDPAVLLQIGSLEARAGLMMGRPKFLVAPMPEVSGEECLRRARAALPEALGDDPTEESAKFLMRFQDLWRAVMRQAS